MQGAERDETGLNWAEIPLRRKMVSLGACLVACLCGLFGMIGIWAEIPRFYDWFLMGEVMSIQSATTVVLLSLGLMILLERRSRDGGIKCLVASTFFAIVLLMALAELLVYLSRNPYMELIDFLVPDSPLLGSLYIYMLVSLFCASITSLMIFCRCRQSIHLTIMQSLTLLLLNLAAFGFVENWGPPSAVRFFTSVPSSVGLFSIGVALFFWPYPDYLPLARPFFGSLQTRVYTWLVCIVWMALVVWQGLLNNFYRAESTFRFPEWYTLAVTDELIEVVLAISVLGGGLHILGTLSRNTRLANELQSSTQNLQEAFDSFALLAATLSHDLKAPIQTQISALEMMKSEYFGANIAAEKNQRMISTLIDNNHYELDLVTNLVDMMRYEIHEEKFAPASIEINTFLIEIQQEMHPLAQRKNQQLLVHLLEDSLATVYADATGLKRILHNLIANAVQHLPGETRIEVSVETQSREVVFTVEDNGPGLPEGMEESLFDKFAQGPEESRILSSSGLGLYISRQIVERHGGRIWVESQPGEGTCFCFALPAQADVSVSSVA